MSLKFQCLVLHVVIFCNVICCINFGCLLIEGPIANLRSISLKAFTVGDFYLFRSVEFTGSISQTWLLRILILNHCH